jgi:hypothetical protein
MPFTNLTGQASGRVPVPTAAGGETITARVGVALVLADLDTNDAGTVMILPAGHVFVSAMVDGDQLDTNGTPTLLTSIGVMNAADTDLAVVWASGLTVGRTAGGSVVAVPNTIALMRDTPSPVDRRIGFKFATGSATKAAGVMGLTLQYRAA